MSDTPSTMSTAKYAKHYRSRLEFERQADAKNFFAARDVTPSIDMEYLRRLNDRLNHIVTRIARVLPFSVRVDDPSLFCRENVDFIFGEVMRNGLIGRLNNQGRRCEEVYFSWTRGAVMMRLFEPAIARIFEIERCKLVRIGEDDFASPETFRRTPRADLMVEKDDGRIYLEIQSGFQGINDVKQHKVLEAKNRWRTDGVPTAVVHIDLFNGQAALIRLDTIADDDVRWITRQQMEGQTVFEIDPNHFVWRILEDPPSFREIESLEAIQ